MVHIQSVSKCCLLCLQIYLDFDHILLCEYPPSRLMSGEVLSVVANEYCPDEIHSVDGSHNMHTIDMHIVERRMLQTLQEMHRSCAVGPVVC